MGKKTKTLIDADGKLHITCSECGHKYIVEPIQWVESEFEGLYSSERDFCTKCGEPISDDYELSESAKAHIRATRAYRLDNIHFGTGRWAKTIYARLVDPLGEMVISAKLDYIMTEAKKRGIKVQGVKL